MACQNDTDGSVHRIVWVIMESQPTSGGERLKVLQKMLAHTQFCWPGDNTIEVGTRLNRRFQWCNNQRLSNWSGHEFSHWLCLCLGFGGNSISYTGPLPPLLRSSMPWHLIEKTKISNAGLSWWWSLMPTSGAETQILWLLLDAESTFYIFWPGLLSLKHWNGCFQK